MAAKKSIAECCLMNMVDRQIITTAKTTKHFHRMLMPFSLVQTEAMPTEYATCREGHTPVKETAQRQFLTAAKYMPPWLPAG